jgi:hypothetical protein
MSDTYFFGKRMNLNQGGRVNFSNGGPGFYNQADQDLYAGGLQYLPQEQYRLSLGDNNQVNRLDFNNLNNSGIMSQTTKLPYPYPYPMRDDDGGGGGGGINDDKDDEYDPSGRKTGKFGINTLGSILGFALNPFGFMVGKIARGAYDNYKNPYKNILGGLNKDTKGAIARDQARENTSRDQDVDSGRVGGNYGEDQGTRCFEPNTLIQMADGSEKKIKEIQLGDQTKGGEVTGVFQFKVTVDEIHNYKGVTVAGSHFVKEDGKFIMVQDSPISVKIDKIPVVYSLDTTGRRIFINDIEFADYNGDGVAKGFLANAGIDVPEFKKEVLRQVENRLI